MLLLDEGGNLLDRDSFRSGRHLREELLDPRAHFLLLDRSVPVLIKGLKVDEVAPDVLH